MASNVVQEASTVWLTNEVLEAARAPLETRDGQPAGTNVVVETAVTNGVQVVRTRRLRRQFAAPAGAALDTGGGQTILLGMEGGAGCVWPGSGLVSWWPGEGNATDIWGQNDGEPVNGLGFTSGKAGDCFNLNHQSSQSVRIPYDASLATPSFSIECWVRPTAQVGWQAFVYGQSYGRQLVLQNGGSGMWVSLYVTAPSGTFYGVRSLTKIPVGEWRHLAGTWDGTHLRVYINGSLSAQASPVLPAIGDSGCPFSIGGINNSCGYSGQYFPGLIDEVSVYDRALFPGEVTNIYLANAAGKCTSPPLSCTDYPASIVSWWAGECDAADWAGLSPGELPNGAGLGAAGMCRTALGFNGTDQAVRIPYLSDLGGSAFSVEAWVKPAEQVDNGLGQAFIFGQNYGRQLVVRAGSRGLGVAWVISNDPWTFYEAESSGEIPIGQWTHLVGTWDGASLKLYINGGFDKEEAFETTAWDSGCPFHIGGVYDPSGNCPYVGQFFNGLIDEVTYYNQALSAADAQALYNAGSAGKCPVPPTVVSSPEPQTTVTAGNYALLHVTAKGTLLSYQWYLNGTQPVGDGQSTLYLANVQAGSAGTYTVHVGNEVGSVPSEGAVITVNPAVAIPLPAGAVAWWRGEDAFTLEDTTAEDMIGNNDGTPECGVGAGTAAGKAGYAFTFDGSCADLRIHGGGLDSSSWEGFTVEGWVYPYDVSIARPIMEQWNSGSGRRITLSLAACGLGSLELTYVDSGVTHELCSLPGVLRAHAFQHIALACKNHQGTTFLKLYVNGQLVAENSGLAMALGADDLHFGASPSAALGTHFWGLMDELAVYNRPLEGSEILAIYDASIAGKIPPCTDAPANCVSWWQGEENGLDVYALNPAILPMSGVTFTPGNTGYGFDFDGTTGVRIPASPSLNVGAGSGFTLEAWVKPDSVATAQPILEWNSGQFTGVALWLSEGGVLAAAIQDATFMDCLIYGGNLSEGVFQHVALTYSAAEHKGRLFLNGSQIGEMECFLLLPVLTMYDLCFGFSPADDLGTGTQFTGHIDEVGLYGRALEDTEIRQLYTRGGGGKCGVPPRILTQPQSQAANAGNNVAFTVVATGTSLTYQWSFDNGGGAQPIAGATSSTLTLMDLQAGHAGTYSVTAANGLDSMPSSDATLTVAPVGNGNPPVISTQPESATSACEGGSFDLSLTASGADTLRYQWCRNGINLNGQTGSTYVCSPVSSRDAATYTVVVYDSVGHITSAQAVVSVHPRPTGALTLPDGGTIQPGGSTYIEVVLAGTGPWTLVWSDGHTETVPADDNPHERLVTPTSTTTYRLVGLSDQHCAALPGELSSTAVVTVQGASLMPPKRAVLQPLENDHDYYNLTFGADQFFYVEGTVRLHGTTTIEGGTMVFFPANATAKIIICDPDIVCDTGPYRTATFLSAEMLNFMDWFGNPPVSPPSAAYYGAGVSLAFEMSSSVALKYLQFFNLGCGVSIDTAGTYKLYHCQFTDCSDAVAVTAAGADVQFYNLLFSDNANVFAPSGAAESAPQLTFQHITVDNSDDGHNFVSAGLAGGTWAGLNSLLVNVAGVPGGLDHCQTLSTGEGVFQSGGDGSHYLAPDTYQGDGTTSTLDPTLSADLTQKTTHPPLDLPLPFVTSGSVTLGPQVPRYAAESQPDLGYYYDALDYTASSVALLPGGNMTVLPGTAIGLRNDWFAAFIVEQGASFSSQGTPNRPNTFAPVWTVQEGPFIYCPGFDAGFVVSFLPDYWPEVVGDPDRYADCNPGGDPPPVLDFRFSNFYLPAGGPSHHFWSGQVIPCLYRPFFLPETALTSAMFLQMRDCALHGGWINLGEPDSYGGIAPVAQPWWPPEWEPYGGPAVPGSVALVNNLFNRVNINLDPDTGPTWWGGPYENPTINLRLTATNNTFRGGWLALEPVNASEGNWVFENNLFDKTVFAQDQYQPLDYDYNAYWPCEGEELDAGQLAHLVPTPTADDYNGTYDGNHELELGEEPPYEPGPLGNFYLPHEWHPQQTSPLAGAGSCLPAGVGLFHYTTRVDQTKAGEETGNVNIGLHYIALGAGQPTDEDGDNIPDYVENWHGDGDYSSHTDKETDWQAAETVVGTADSLSPIHDDVDLDGDGMVGRIERALHPADPQPLVPDNPLALAKLTTGDEPDIATFEVDVPSSILAAAGGLRLNVDGVDARVQQPDYPVGQNTRLAWNTTYEAPGLHFVQPCLTLTGTGIDTAILSCVGPLVPFYSDNVCRFFECDALFDENGACLDAQLPVPNATYSIQLYDPSTETPTLLKTIPEKSTSNGMIQEDWVDLICEDGVTAFTGSAFDAVFDISLLNGVNGAPIAHGIHTKRHGKIVSTEQGNGFDLAYMYTARDGTLADSFDHGPVWIGMQGVVDTLMQPVWVWPYAWYESSFNIFTSPGCVFGYPGYVTSMANITGSLYPSMSDGLTKNFYCYAHGTPNTLRNTAGDVSITAGEVAALLGNQGLVPGVVIPGNPYRFVFLDACLTAKDNQWRHAFGIMSLAPTDSAARAMLGPQAFVGWSHRVPDLLGCTPDGTHILNLSQSKALQSAYTATLQLFFTDWMNGRSLWSCIARASNPNFVQCPLPSKTFKQCTIGPPYTTPYGIPSFTVPNESEGYIRIYGHPGLTRNGLDHEADRATSYDAPSNRR